MLRYAFWTKCAQGVPQIMLLLVLMVALSSAEVKGFKVHCEVSALPHGRFRYQLRTELGPDPSSLPVGCTEREWKDTHNIVLTQGTDVNKTLVYNLSDWTLELNQCLDFTHFQAHCRLFVEAFCRTNCSLLTQADPPSVDPSMDPSAKSAVITPSVVAGAIVLLAVALITWKVVLPTCRNLGRPRFSMVFAKEEDLPEFKVAPNEVITA